MGYLTRQSGLVQKDYEIMLDQKFTGIIECSSSYLQFLSFCQEFSH